MEAPTPNSFLALVFTGQGSQKVGMGREFHDTFGESREVYQRASESLGIDVAALCFEEGDKLERTEFAQPAILTTEIAILRALESQLGIEGTFFAGHSLGEYAALVASGTFEIGDAVKMVRRRGELMQTAVPQNVGGMAALVSDELPTIPFEEILTEYGVEIANFNSPAQVVVSGPRDGVTKAIAAIKERHPQVTTVLLAVGSPFHSSMMRSIEEEFRSYLQSFEARTRPENCRAVMSNFTGSFHLPDSLIDSLASQISGRVRWLDNMKVLAEHAPRIIDVGPQRVLSKFFASIGVTCTAVTDMRSFKKLSAA